MGEESCMVIFIAETFSCMMTLILASAIWDWLPISTLAVQHTKYTVSLPTWPQNISSMEFTQKNPTSIALEYFCGKYLRGDLLLWTKISTNFVMKSCINEE